MPFFYTATATSCGCVLDPYFHHKAEWMGDLEDAVKYKPNRLEGQVSMDIDFKDIDADRIFTNEEIGQMSNDEFERLENFINQQVQVKLCRRLKQNNKYRQGI